MPATKTKQQAVQQKITVIRRVVTYEEAVFDSVEEFESWKALSEKAFGPKDEDHTMFDDFREITEKKFANIEFETCDFDPTLYIAVVNDVTSHTDDWISLGIFEDAVEDSDFSSLRLIEEEYFEVFRKHHNLSPWGS